MWAHFSEFIIFLHSAGLFSTSFAVSTSPIHLLLCWYSNSHFPKDILKPLLLLENSGEMKIYVTLKQALLPQTIEKTMGSKVWGEKAWLPSLLQELVFRMELCSSAQPYSYVRGQTEFTNQNNISLLASTWDYSAFVPLNCMEKIANDIFSLYIPWPLPTPSLV